jgi:hypothetical protein
MRFAIALCLFALLITIARADDGQPGESASLETSIENEVENESDFAKGGRFLCILRVCDYGCRLDGYSYGDCSGRGFGGRCVCFD